MASVPQYVQDYYEDSFAWCFGCGRLNESGHHFKTRWDGARTLTVFTPKTEHTAVPGFVYGGLLASLIDCHSTGSASLALYRRDGHELGAGTPVPRCMTASLNVTYHKPTPLGPELVVYGTIKDLGQRKAIVASELTVEGHVTVTAEVVAVWARSIPTRN